MQRRLRATASAIANSATRVFPEPVGAETSTLCPFPTASTAWIWNGESRNPFHSVTLSWGRSVGLSGGVWGG